MAKAEWEQMDGPLHRLVISDRVVAYITTRSVGWSCFGQDAPDWWWRIDVDGISHGMDLVDERMQDLEESAFREAQRVARQYGVAAQAYLDKMPAA